MSTIQTSAKQLLTLLANEAGWHVVRVLARSDYHMRELVTLLGYDEQTITEQIAALRDLGLLTERQSDANANDMFYRLKLDELRDAYMAAGAALHPVVGGVEDVQPEQLPHDKPRVLVLCTGNSIRSQMAEGLIRHLSHGKVDVSSAGTNPTQVHPLAIETMTNAGVDISQQRSKHLDEFIDQSFDYVVTVCDQQHETCPTFPGQSERIHWSFPDPAQVASDAQPRTFKTTAMQLQTMIRFFLIFVEKQGKVA